MEGTTVGGEFADGIDFTVAEQPIFPARTPSGATSERLRSRRRSSERSALFYTQASLYKITMLKLQANLHDGSVAPEFMTYGPSEAEEMRAQRFAFDCVAKVRILDDPG
jgi:hypothetical protein